MSERSGRDRRALFLGALLVALLFLALDLHYTGGEVVLPLDDAYIYAQYARSLAEGHPFRFTPGAERSAGITGLLYPFVLAPLYLLGLGGAQLPAFIFLLNAILLAVSATTVYELTGGSGRRDVSLLAGWLFVLAGPMAWGFLSGMEVGLFVTVWLLGALALLRGRDTAAVSWTSVLTLVRPDGLVWAAALFVMLPLAEGRRGRGWRVRALWAVPLLVGAIPILVNLALTGGIAPASGRPKSPFALPGHHLPTIVQHAVGFIVTATKGLLSGLGGREIHGTLNRLDTWIHVPPFTLLVLIAAIVPALMDAARRRRVETRSLCAAWFLLSLAWVAVSTGSTTHFFRYLLPAWPAVVVLMAEGCAAIGRTLAGAESESRRLRIHWSVGAYLLAFSALGTVTFALIYGQAAHGFARQYVDCSRWIDENLPERARIASLDAGILGYYSGREFFDLYGLTTPSMHDVTMFYAEDEGSKFEVMERLPVSLRPTHFVLHERRLQHENWNPYRALMTTDGAGNDVVLHSCRSLIRVPLVGRNLQVWPADWSLAGSGDAPGAPVTGRVVDRVDISDPLSERDHGARLRPAAPGFIGGNRFGRRPAPGGRMVIDAGRGIAGDLSLALSNLTPGRDVTVRLRVLPVGGGETLRVSVGGRRPIEVELPAGRGDRWLEPAFVIDGTAVDGASIDLTLSGTMMIYHLWAIQEPVPSSVADE
ncbi:MAG: hypothetical protein OEQ13_11895 [Acidobacteriota bacterium]|nr:hypothetical protein [Acidobacteriota bacterium]